MDNFSDTVNLWIKNFLLWKQKDQPWMLSMLYKLIYVTKTARKCRGVVQTPEKHLGQNEI